MILLSILLDAAAAMPLPDTLFSSLPRFRCHCRFRLFMIIEFHFPPFRSLPFRRFQMMPLAICFPPLQFLFALMPLFFCHFCRFVTLFR